MTLPIYSPHELAPGETREPELVNGRFRIKTPEGKQVLYTRMTTFIRNLDDRSKLEEWKNRIVAVGFRVDQGLQAELIAVDPDDKDALNKLVQRAFEAGDGHVQAAKGTQLHDIAEQWDKLATMPSGMTDADIMDLHAYVDICARAGLEILETPFGPLIEKRIVIDHMKVTGTPDRGVRYKCLDGKTRNVILDLKTKKLTPEQFKPGDTISFGRGEMAQQLAGYAAGKLYFDDGSPTARRESLPDVSRTHGLILHLPQGGAVQGIPPTLYEVDLSMGWRGVDLSKQVREWRNYSKTVLHEVPLT